MISNMNHPKVSVVVPFYNRSEFLKRLLDSVYSQSFRVSEVFVIDNGSEIEDSLRAWEIIQKHSMSDTCCFVSTLKRGNANYARNLGYYLSGSEYVAYLDSDDWWGADHLRNSIRLLESSEKVGCYSGSIVHMPKGVTVYKSADIDTIGCPFRFLFGRVGGSAPTPSFVISKKKMRDAVAWDESLKRSQDQDYFISIHKETSGWIYKPEQECHIDWEQGGTRGPIDVTSIVRFYEKWSSEWPKGLEVMFLLKYISIFEARGMDKRIGELTDSISDSPFNRMLFSTPCLYILRLILRVRTKLKSFG